MRDRRLVVVPSEPIEAYERAGYGSWLERYYNPGGFFREVHAISPLEGPRRRAHGMTIRRVPERDLSGVIEEIRPDVVRAYGAFWPSDYVAAGRVAGIPVVVSVHDSRPERIHDSIIHADAVFCVSGVVRRRVLDRGVSPDVVRILPNRVDTTRFAPRRDAPEHAAIARRFPPGRHILHVGRRSDEKNLDTVIRALARLPADYSCVFIGRDDPDPWRRLADREGVAGRCFWIESVPNDALPIWYNWCDCLCVPSRWEGFGIVFLEAAACGTPVVTSDIPPMNEYLAGGESAELVARYEDPEAIAAAIRSVCEDGTRRGRIADGAVRAARAFDVARVDAMERGFYEEILEGRLGRPPDAAALAAWRAGRAGTGWSARLRAAARRAGRILHAVGGDR